MSPAIDVKEIDLTGVAPNVETSLTGMVGQFQWGPVNEPTSIQNKQQLVEVFGTPSPTNAVDFYSADKYLQYSSNLIINRQITQTGEPDATDSALNSTLSGGVLLVENDKSWEGISTTETFVGKYPGSLGNSLSVSIFAIESGSNDSASATLDNWVSWPYANRFDGIPGTSTWARQQSTSTVHDEVHVVVIDHGGKISGTKNTVLEIYPYVSVAYGAKTVDNGNNYIGDAINNGSSYIRFGDWTKTAGVIDAAAITASPCVLGANWGKTPEAAVNAGVSDFATDVAVLDFTAAGKVTNPLTGGADHQALTTGDFALAFDNFEDPEAVDVQILVAPGMTTSASQITVVNDLVAIAEGIRKDCVIVTSPDRTSVVNNANPVGTSILTCNGFSASNYLFVDNNYLRVRDEYNDNYIYIPAASSTAGLFAATDANYGPWYSPAGEQRGEYLGISDLAYTPNKSDRDTLYKVGINPIVQFSGRGVLLFGDKTKQSRPSAFDRINVRRLFLAIEKSIAIAARNFMFEFNDDFTRSEFVAIVEPLLREIQSRRGISDFFVQCDNRNNTSEVIARNEMVASMFIKPAYSINFITLNFVATRDGSAFEEVVGTLS